MNFTPGPYRLLFHGLLICVAASIVTVSACSKQSIEEMTQTQVSFLPKGITQDDDTQTKASVVTSLDGTGFWASAVTGSAGNDVAAWTNVKFSKSGSDFKGGKFWPLNDPQYRFYASSSQISYSSAGATISASNSTDIVCAYKASPTYGTRNTLQFDHIFARLSTVKINAVAPYNISNITVWIVNPKTGGTYNLRTGSGKTDGTGWSSLTPTGSSNTSIYSRSEAISSGGSNTGGNNDLYVVPGNYLLLCTWTAYVGDYSQGYTTKTSTSSVFLQGGKVNSITCNLSGDATSLTVGVNVTAWGSTNKTATF